MRGLPQVGGSKLNRADSKMVNASGTALEHVWLGTRRCGKLACDRLEPALILRPAQDRDHAARAAAGHLRSGEPSPECPCYKFIACCRPQTTLRIRGMGLA